MCRLQCLISDFSTFSVGVKVPRAFDCSEVASLHLRRLNGFISLCIVFWRNKIGCKVNWEKTVDSIYEISKCRHWGLGWIWLEFLFFSTETREEIEGLFLRRATWNALPVSWCVGGVLCTMAAVTSSRWMRRFTLYSKALWVPRKALYTCNKLLLLNIFQL